MRRWLTHWLWLLALASYLVAVWVGAIELRGGGPNPWGGYLSWAGAAILAVWLPLHSREMRRLRAELIAVHAENAARRAELQRRWAE